MQTVSRKTRQKSWRSRRPPVSVLAEMALRQEKVAERLAGLRERDNLTQEQAAAKVGVTLRQWQRWEAGESMPYPRNLDMIASRFGFTVSEFFDEAQPNGNGKDPAIAELAAAISQLGDQMAEILRRLPPEDEPRPPRK